MKRRLTTWIRFESDLDGKFRTMSGYLSNITLEKLIIKGDGHDGQISFVLSSNKMWDYIRDRLEAGLKSLLQHSTLQFTAYLIGGYLPNEVKIDFAVTQGSEFCNTAIECALEVFKVLGIMPDKRIGDFKIYQITHVRYRGDWIPYAKYLAIKHGLTS